MPLYLLDTDHVSLLQRGHPQIAAYFASVADDEVVTSVITFEEQLRGRLEIVNRSASPEQAVMAYLTLRQAHQFFCAIQMFDFGTEAAHLYQQLRTTHRRLSKMDLRIAATALANSAVLVTRNWRDFSKIPKLELNDWTAAS